MRVKDRAKTIHDKTKRHRKSNQNQDEDSSDDIPGKMCHRQSQSEYMVATYTSTCCICCVLTLMSGCLHLYSANGRLQKPAYDITWK